MSSEERAELMDQILGEFSVAASAIPKIKGLLRQYSFEDSKKLAQDILQTKDQDSLLKRLSASKG